jgi:hypothetical protein
VSTFLASEGTSLNIRTALKILLGVGIATGLLAVVFLLNGEWGGFFGTLVVSLGFVGLNWGGRRMFLPGEGKGPGHGMNLVIGVVFGGAGLSMLIGGALLLIDGEVGAAVGLFVFGLVFCAAAYVGWRVFAEPKGMKAVLVGAGARAIQGELGQSGKLTGGTYLYVDQATPEAEIERMRKEWSEKPWTQRSDWAEGKVVQEGTSNIRLLVIFTILWNVIGWSIAGVAFWSEWSSSDVPWFMLVFPAFGVVLVVVTIRTWVRKRRFGTSVLHCKTIPFRLGDRVQGTIQTGVPLGNQAGKSFTVRLTCVRRITVLDRDRDERVTEERLWSHEEMTRGGVSGAGPVFQVSVDIAVPEGLPPTELHPEDDRALWRLAISSKEKGVDYAAQFEVPVYARSPAS